MLNPYKGLRQLTLDDALNYPGLDAVLVEVPNADLLDMAFLCVSKNLPMHLDKPPCEDLSRFRQLLNLCQEKKLPLQMGYMYRVNPAMQFCRKLVKEGVLGTITDVEMDMSHDYGGEPYQHYLSTFKGGVL